MVEGNKRGNKGRRKEGRNRAPELKRWKEGRKEGRKEEKKDGKNRERQCVERDTLGSNGGRK